MVMSLGVVVGDLFASCEVGDLLASADRRDKGGMDRFTAKRRGKMAEAAFVAKVVPENAWYVFPVGAAADAILEVVSWEPEAAVEV